MKVVYFWVYVHIIVRGSRLCLHDRVHTTRVSESYSEAAYSQVVSLSTNSLSCMLSTHHDKSNPAPEFTAYKSFSLIVLSSA